MEHHINVLYGAVLLLLIVQLISFTFISSQSAKLIAQQNNFEEGVGDTLNQIRQENQYRISEIVRSLSQQRTDFENQISFLKSTQQDFSLIIEDAIKKVVTVTTDVSAGTGFAVGKGGYILTNNHVITGSSAIQVQTYSNEVYVAQLLGVDENADLAVLKISGKIDSFNLSDSDLVSIGEKVIAIGNPLGLSFTVTEGIVSALHRQGPNGLQAYIQTDVTLNPGNSGGPLVDKKGNVIGMANFKVGGAEALGFALESNVLRKIANEIVGSEIIS
ncbi:trypsin-like peptidase domain-containing protein [Candidatus Pacearchaeota archaeon]|nr:trypsin-like peptidase domain-containing protein [Candidatus Pacearchaeota archaeon]